MYVKVGDECMPRNKNPEETVQGILTTALELFKTKGYEQTTILDIVDKMGVSRGAFYHHFKSKEEVLYAILEGREDSSAQMKIYNDPNLTGLEKIRALFLNQRSPDSKESSEDIELMYMWLRLLKDPRLLSEHIKEMQGENLSWVNVLVEAGMEDGSIKKQDPQLLSELMFLLLHLWTVPTIYPTPTVELFERKIWMIKNILDGLGCPLIDENFIEVFMHRANLYEE